MLHICGGQSLSHKTNEHKKLVHNNTTFGLNCIYLNADSLLNKRDELRAVVSQTEPDIIAITEVLPKNTRTPVQPSELRLEGYNMFWNSNPRRGVCIYSKSSLKCDEVDINVDGAQESVWISTQLAGQDKLLIGCMYLSPNSSAENEDKIRQTLQKASDSKYSHLLITGDFNQPDIDWTNCTSLVTSKRTSGNQIPRQNQRLLPISACHTAHTPQRGAASKFFGPYLYQRNGHD